MTKASSHQAPTIGIVHFGVGNFHRAHQSPYFDEYMRVTGDHGWGILGVGMTERSRSFGQRDAADPGGHHLLVRHADGRAQIDRVTADLDHVWGPGDPERVVAQIANPSTKLVTMTITEGGYHLDPASMKLDEHDPDVRHDERTPAAPRTFYGYLAEGLRRRAAAGSGPLTVLCCDNLQQNGELVKDAFLAFVARATPELLTWVGDNVTFPNSMVDRLAPTVTADDIRVVRESLSLDYEPVVAVTEPFSQWVIDDHFAGPRPRLEEVGVQFVPDVVPFETAKLRTLNGAHQAIAYFGLLKGQTFVHEALSDPLVRPFVEAYLLTEVIPTLHPGAGIDYQKYAREGLGRFANPNLADTLARLAAYASDRIPGAILPTVHDLVRAGRSASLAAAIVASWCEYLRQRDHEGRRSEVVDSRATALMEAAASSDPLEFLLVDRLFGGLELRTEFVDLYLGSRRVIQSEGPDRAMAAAMGAASGRPR